MGRLVAATLAALALLPLAACAEAPPPQAEVARKFAPCADSEATTCENGTPLCMMDEERACEMCRCSAFALAAPPLRAGNTQVPSTASPSQPIFAPITVR
jgi:hypothetical protein